MRYWVSLNNQTHGPFSLDEIAAMLQDGRVGPTTLAALEGSDQWAPLSDLIDIQTPPPPPVAQRPATSFPYAGTRTPHLPVSQPRTVSPAFIITIVVIFLLAGGFILVRNSLAKAAAERASETRQIANETRVKGNFVLLNMALENYLQRVGSYPTQSQGLNALIRKPADVPNPDRWIRLVKSDHIPPDPWGNPYVYRFDSGRTWPVLISRGPDGKLDTADDLRSDSL